VISRLRGLWNNMFRRNQLDRDLDEELRAYAELIRSQLFGLDARDPLTLLGASLVLAVTGGLAGFLPALRASSVNPTTALRQA
jgi:ABC-type lipoprotein release transport system permease subunit